jgi:hypothetical protein
LDLPWGTPLLEPPCGTNILVPNFGALLRCPPSGITIWGTHLEGPHFGDLPLMDLPSGTPFN